MRVTYREYQIDIDKEDMHFLVKNIYTINGSGYLTRNGGSLHRDIMKPPANYEVDHINHNKLDNRKENLRVVTHSQNHFNGKLRSDNKYGIKGLLWRAQYKKWQASIIAKGVNIHLGSTADFFEACCLRKSAELKYHAIPLFRG